ncbi:MAG: GTP-sensing pleiotropic transcriptional regulator CodY [Lachnospiraceae bacterium]|nr:GTP-sensing pleiotropic transcriptional regulator CodY [Lachnospiraceae bacterium]
MSSVELLDKTRRIGRLLHEVNDGKVVFNDICRILSDTLLSDILVVSRKGKLLGIGEIDRVPRIEELIPSEVGVFIDPLLNERFLSVLSTKENVNLETLGFTNIDTKRYTAIAAPVEIAGDRLGTIFIYKIDEAYEIDDIILCEYATTVVGLEMLRAESEENAEEERKHQVMESAIKTLSYSEMEAIVEIFEELTDGEGVLVASRVADRVGITRSVIVNALRKFESAGVIETRSSGMKGTYIKVLNDVAFAETKKLKTQLKKRQ